MAREVALTAARPGAAPGLIVVVSEKGDLVLLRATPEGHQEFGTIAALSDDTWNHPEVVDDRLYVRNAAEIVCYQLPTDVSGAEVPETAGHAAPRSCPARRGSEAATPMADDKPPRAAPEPDFYVERGLLVYTAAHHLKRGSCCGSGCRHCPYEPRHVAGNRRAAPPKD